MSWEKSEKWFKIHFPPPQNYLYGNVQMNVIGRNTFFCRKYLFEFCLKSIGPQINKFFEGKHN